jgi:hypothetical protein
MLHRLIIIGTTIMIAAFLLGLTGGNPFLVPQ